MKTMKNKIISVLSMTVLLFGLSGCQTPQYLESNVVRLGITSMTAKFPNDNSSENEFPAEIDYTNHVIKLVFPYNYPTTSDIVLPESALKRVRVSASLEPNVEIRPELLFMDLTQENYITVTDKTSGSVTDYKVTAEIRKSAECSISDFSIPALGLSGVVNELARSISIITPDEIGEQLADVTLSHGATISPDPRVVALNYDQEQTVTVTAQNGKDNKQYTINKTVPAKVPFGIRPNSGQLLWSKYVSELSGITDPAGVKSVAPLDDYLLVCEKGSSSIVYLNAKTGEYAGTIDVGSFAGNNMPFHITTDDDGNILVCNLTAGKENFVVWRSKGIDQPFEKYIEFYAEPKMGWNISVAGSLDADAIITTYAQGAALQYARWQVQGGALVSPEPDLISVQETNCGFQRWGDAIYTDPANIQSDYLAAGHAKYNGDGKRYFFLVNGVTHQIKATGPAETTSNTPISSVDYIEFNKSAYVTYNYVNPFTWTVGVSDAVLLYDITSGVFGSPIVTIPSKEYGALGKNANGYGDVALHENPNGYYLYLYFVFANGRIGCIQYDCLEF